MTQITFIWHDCFFVERPEADIVFDFWLDPETERGELPLFLSDRDKEKPLYIFVSHHHKDHLSKEIFSWVETSPNIHFILSHDTAKFCRHILSKTSTYSGIKPDPEQVIVLRPGESVILKDIKVEAFGSTDIGNSYFVRIGDETFFHAGDLNAWIWKDESTAKEVEMQINAFTKIVDVIASSHPEIDNAFFPVDSRIGRDYFTGASIFVRKLIVKRFFPMHFCLGDTPDTTKEYTRNACDFKNYCNPERGVYIGLTTPYSSFLTISEKDS